MVMLILFGRLDLEIGYGHVDMENWALEEWTLKTGTHWVDLRAIWETNVNVLAWRLFGNHAMREVLGSK
jgi:hypothetical protein